MLKVLQNFLDNGVGAEEFKQAKMRLLNAEVFDVDTSHKVLERISGLEFYEYPWNFYEHASSAIKDLTAEQVIAACRRHLDPSQLTIFVAGNVAEFDRDFKELGEVQMWDAAAPVAQSVETPTAEVDKQEVQAMVDNLLSSHGGRKAWESVGAVWAKLSTNGQTQMEAWIIHPRRFRELSGSGEELNTLVLDDYQAWSYDGTNLLELNAERVAEMHAGIGDKLPMILMRLARDEYRLATTGKNVLVLNDGMLTIEVGDDGLCRKVISDSGEYSFSNYALSGAVMMPLVTSWSDGTQAQSFDFEWKINPEVSADWFQRP